MLVPKTGDTGSNPVPPTMTNYQLALNKLKESLSCRRYIHHLSPNFSPLTNKTIKIFYGETYDIYGLTIDSLKYYFFLSLLHRILIKSGLTVESTVIIADVASGINQSSQKYGNDLDKIGAARLKYCQKLKKYFNLPVNFVLMSNLFSDDKFSERIKLVEQLGQINSKVKGLLAQTVLRNRIKQEASTGFRYGLEAIATGTFFDLKIGPPREQFYDQAAAIITDQLKFDPLSSIYLQPTFPLGQDYSYFLTHPEFEEFGVTPYKAGSNQLQDFRIVINNHSLENINQLISDTYITSNPTLPNPIFELLFIAELAQKIKHRDYTFPEFSDDIFFNSDDLKKMALPKITKLLVELISL